MPKQKPAPKPEPKPEVELVELNGFPRRLKRARLLAGLSQEKLADAAGMDKGQISRFEKGERVAAAHMSTIIKLARALGQPTGWLAAEEGDLAIPVFREPTDRRRKPKA